MLLFLKGGHRGYLKGEIFYLDEQKFIYIFILLINIFLTSLDFWINYTVRTVAADLRQGEHIPKMQNNIDRKSTLRVLRQPRSKGGGGAGCHTVPWGARPGAGFCRAAVDLL